MPAYLAKPLKADEEDRRSDDAPLVRAKENEEVVETNLRRGDAEEKADVATDRKCDPGVRRSRARPRRLCSVVGAVRPRRALCDSCQDTAHVVVSCFSCPLTCHRSTGRATLAMRWTA